MKKYIVFIDMDGVLANFDAGIPNKKVGTWVVDPPEMFERSFFTNLLVLPGAREAISKLLTMDHLDLYIASQPVTKGDFLHSPSEKYEWIRKHFPELINKVFLTCDKTLLKGDFLIDDQSKWDEFDGTFLQFNTARSKDNWKVLVESLSILNYS